MEQNLLDELIVQALVAKFKEGIEVLKQSGITEREIYAYSSIATDVILRETKQEMKNTAQWECNK